MHLLCAAILLGIATGVTSLPAPADELRFDGEQRIIRLPGIVNGDGPHALILDTGATETVLTPVAARAAGLRVVPAGPGQDSAIVREFTVGKATVKNLRVFIFDPPQALSLRLDHGIDYHGLLGYTFLRQFITRIDYRRHAVQFEPVEAGVSADPAPSGATLPFTLNDQLILVRGRLNGLRPLKFLVDTGAADSIVRPRVAEELRLRTAPMPKHPGAAFAIAETITVGSASVTNLPVVVHLPAQEQPGRTPYDGILGHSFLTNFVVTINYAAGRLTLER